MKRNFQITVLSASVASLLAFSAFAQVDSTKQTDRPDYRRDRITSARRADRLNGAAKANDLIGMSVKNYQGEKLGKVEDLALDVESGRVVQVILSIGGFAGIGDTLTAVPPGSLHHDVAAKVLHLDADKEKLKNSPKFEMSRWAECCDNEHVVAVYRYYGEDSALVFVTQEDPTTDVQRIPASRLRQMQRASKVIGTSVKNLQEEKLGKVENILVDLGAGRLVAVILSSGGFLGMGDELSAIPPTALRYTSNRDALHLDASKDQLSSAPHFKSNQWPDFAQPTYSQSIYRAYKVEPYFTTDVDNTAQNVRDRNDRTLTPLDQGNSKADVDTTARIRKEIVAGKDLSVNAKNVKIITANGRVTLRGAVTTEDEKRIIGEIASRIATADNVDNQLEVKRANTGNN